MQRTVSLLLLSLFAVAPTALASGSGPGALFDGFEGGVNKGGWTYNPGDILETTGGNPGGWWHQPVADTYGPIITSTNPNLSGDWRATGVDFMRFDAILNALDFGTGSGFEMAVLLRNTKGTPLPDDDDYAYLVGPNIPLKGAGWKTFNFPIPSQDTSPVPTGWKGGWAGDVEHFRPGIDWNDVITSVDRVEIHWLNPAYFAIFQQWNVGLDNIYLRADGTATLRNGAGGNPATYVSTSTPDVGMTWTSTIDIATPGHLLSVVAVSLGGPAAGIFPGGSLVGELLIQPNFFTVDVQTGAHAFPLPGSPSLFGLCLATQGATIAPTGQIHLCNALDLVIGG